MKSTSPAQKLNSVDYIKTVRFIAVAALGQILIETARYISGLDLGAWTGIVGLLAGAVVEIIRRYMTDHNL